MDKPTWINIIGILGLVFGGMGIFNGGAEIAMPQTMKLQKDLFDDMITNANKEIEKNASKNNSSPKIQVFKPAIIKMLEKFYVVPDWFNSSI